MEHLDLSSDGKVGELIDKEEYWRAKEILQGRLASSGYDTELFEMYGYVLLLMSDKMEAGKYLFLSSVRKPEYAEAIDLFLSHQNVKNLGAFVGRLPAAARRSGLTSVPDSVTGELLELGFSKSNLEKAFASRKSIIRTATVSDRVVSWMGIPILILILGGLGWQAFVGINAIFNFLFG